MAFTYDPKTVNPETVEIWRRAGLDPVPFDGSNFQNPSAATMGTAGQIADNRNYYQTTYANSPSVQAQTVMASGQGQPANTLQNFGPAQGITVDPNAFAANWKYQYGTDFNPAALGMTAIPGSNGQYVTSSGGTFAMPGTTTSPATQAEYDARLKLQQQQVQQAITNRTPEGINYLQHFQTNSLPIGYANPQTEVNQLLSMGLNPAGSSYLNGPGAQYFTNNGITPSQATGVVNPSQLSAPVSPPPATTTAGQTQTQTQAPPPNPGWVQELMSFAASQGIPDAAIQAFASIPGAERAGPGDLFNWWNNQNQNQYLYGNQQQTPVTTPSNNNSPGVVTDPTEQLRRAVAAGQMTQQQAAAIWDNWATQNGGGGQQQPGPQSSGSLFGGNQQQSPPPASTPSYPTDMHRIMGISSNSYQPTTSYNGPAYTGSAVGQYTAPPPIFVGSGGQTSQSQGYQSNTTPTVGTPSTMRWSATGNNIGQNRRPSFGTSSYYGGMNNNTYTSPGQNSFRYW